jgi:hypothetical protein
MEATILRLRATAWRKKNLKMVEAARFEAKEMLPAFARGLRRGEEKYLLIAKKLANKHKISHFE